MKLFYFYGYYFQPGDFVQLTTYEGKQYTGEITDIYECNDHSASVSCLLIQTEEDYAEVQDWAIKDMKMI